MQHNDNLFQAMRNELLKAENENMIFKKQLSDI